ncbi:hypothetical protein [Kribbella sp. NPDC048928]|uniref:hypothetical protein n=1 Tax=Kribbella sp. NPDC048928 TaxID=3364111 RepID=UPI00371E3425
MIRGDTVNVYLGAAGKTILRATGEWLAFHAHHHDWNARVALVRSRSSGGALCCDTLAVALKARAGLPCKFMQLDLMRGMIMALRFVGVDPNTPNSGSPTVWVDDADGSVVIQGWKIDEATMTDVAATGKKWETVPDHEDIVRLPARMIPILKDAIGDS